MFDKATKKGDAYYNPTTSGNVKNFISLHTHGVFDAQEQNYYELDKYHEALQKSEFPIYRGLRLSYENRMRHQIIKHFRIYDTLDLENFDLVFIKSFLKKQHLTSLLKTD